MNPTAAAPSSASVWPHIPTSTAQAETFEIDIIRAIDSAHAAFRLMEGSADPHANVWGVLQTLGAIRVRVLSRRELHSQNVKDILWYVPHHGYKDAYANIAVRI